MNFTINRGDTITLNMSVSASGDDYNLTGSSIWFTAKQALTDPDGSAIFQKTIGNGITITNASKGLATIVISPTDTSILATVKTLLLFDCQVKDASGNIFTVASGNIIVLPDVTLSTS